MGQASPEFLAEKPPNQTCPHWRRGLPASVFFFLLSSFQTWKSFCLTSDQALAFCDLISGKPAGKTKELYKLQNSYSMDKTMRKKWVSCHAAGWSTRNLGIALSLVKLNTPLSTNTFSAGSSTSCYTPRYFKAMWCCFKTLPFVKLKDKYWRMGASVYLSHKNWCLLRKCQCWLWKTHFGVIPAQKNGFVLSIPGGRPVKIAMEDWGMQPPLNPCTARHAHTGECLLWGFWCTPLWSRAGSQDQSWVWDYTSGSLWTSVCLPWDIKGSWAAPFPSLQLEHPFGRTRHKPHF